MRRLKITFLLGAVALVAALLPALSASATDVETVDDAHTVCEVDGGVTLSGHTDNASGGIDPNPSQGHYEFVDTDINCDGQVDSTYDVQADGDTDDIEHSGHGEDCDQGGWDKNDADGDGETSGELTATWQSGPDKGGPNGPAKLTGHVEFHRLGTVVYAYGTLDDGSGGPDDYEYSGEFQFTPAVGQDCVNTPVTSASLTGVAEIGDL